MPIVAVDQVSIVLAIDQDVADLLGPKRGFQEVLEMRGNFPPFHQKAGSWDVDPSLHPCAWQHPDSA